MGSGRAENASSAKGRPKKQRLTVILIGAGFFVLVLVMSYPFQTTVTKEWRIRLTDRVSKYIAGAEVIHSWHWYAADRYGSDETSISGTDGRVRFSSKAQRASSWRRTLHFLSTLANPHTGRGIHESIIVRHEQHPNVQLDPSTTSILERDDAKEVTIVLR
jgi:hypothetical protein